MKYKYLIDAEDHMVFYKHYYKKHNILFKPIIYLIIVAVSALLILTSKQEPSSEPGSELLPDYIVFPIYIAFLSGILIAFLSVIKDNYLKKTRKMIKENSQMIGNIELLLESDKISIKTEFSTQEFMKEAFIAKEEHKNYIYLYQGKQSAIIIPKSTNININQITEWFNS